MSLTKYDIVEKIQRELDCQTIEAKMATSILLEIIKSSLESGDDVLVSGFGKFCVKDKAKRKGRNLSTGKEVMIPARRVVMFKCSAKLRDKLNGG